MLAQIQDTGMTIDLFYVAMRLLEIVLELGQILIIAYFLPKIYHGCEAVRRSFLAESPKEIIQKIKEEMNREQGNEP